MEKLLKIAKALKIRPTDLNDDPDYEDDDEYDEEEDF